LHPGKADSLAEEVDAPSGDSAFVVAVVIVGGADVVVAFIVAVGGGGAFVVVEAGVASRVEGPMATVDGVVANRKDLGRVHVDS
jgi:hypothetical protein